ncbi:hypothetical protein Droror1_Dr00017334, partial [Drosera rotundifolia]
MDVGKRLVMIEADSHPDFPCSGSFRAFWDEERSNEDKNLICLWAGRFHLSMISIPFRVRAPSSSAFSSSGSPGPASLDDGYDGKCQQPYESVRGYSLQSQCSTTAVSAGASVSALLPYTRGPMRVMHTDPLYP